MDTYTIDCAGITCREALHRALAQTLSFPDWYGHNLDALFDCLTEIDSPTQLRLVGWSDLGDWADGFTEVLTQASQENPYLSIIL